jgi:hypothetical protein
MRRAFEMDLVQAEAIASEPAPRAGTVRVGRAIWIAVLGLATAAAALPALFFTPLNHDVACALYYSRRMMAGDRIYRDFVENNPPLAYYVYMPIEWIAQHAAIPEIKVLAAVLVALTIGVMWLGARLLRLEARQSAVARGAVLLSCAAAVLLLPERGLGQREHLTVLLIIPYVLLCAVRADGIARVSRGLTLMVAAAAAVGFGLKPHFCAALLALMVYVAVKRRDLRAALTLENITVVSLLALYAVAVLVWTPEYMTQMVGIAVGHYGAYTSELSQLLQGPTVRLLLAALVMLLCASSWLSGSRDSVRVIQALALTGLAFFVLYVVEGTTFRYHLLPAEVFYVMALATTIATFVGTMANKSTATADPQPPARRTIRLAISTGALTLCALPGVVIGSNVYDLHRADLQEALVGNESPLAGPLIPFVRAAAGPGQPVYVLSTSVNPAFPLINLTGTTWPYRYNTLWLLPTYYRDEEDRGVAVYHAPAAQSPGERAFFDEIIADLRKTPPTVLIVDRFRMKQGFDTKKFDFVEYYSQSPEFAALFREYKLIAQIVPYDVYKRVGPPATR